MSLPPVRFSFGDVYRPTMGPHRTHRVQVVRTRDCGHGYDLVTAACECRRSWRFVHHYARWM